MRSPCCLQHWTLLCVSLLNCLLSTACSVGLALAIALTIHGRGMHLVTGCNSSALPADARTAIVTNDCPFNTTRIYVSLQAPLPALPLFVSASSHLPFSSSLLPLFCPPSLCRCLSLSLPLPFSSPPRSLPVACAASPLRLGAVAHAPRGAPDPLLCRTQPWRSGSPPWCWLPRKLCCLAGALWRASSSGASGPVHAATAKSRYAHQSGRVACLCPTIAAFLLRFEGAAFCLQAVLQWGGDVKSEPVVASLGDRLAPLHRG